MGPGQSPGALADQVVGQPEVLGLRQFVDGVTLAREQVLVDGEVIERALGLQRGAGVIVEVPEVERVGQFAFIDRDAAEECVDEVLVGDVVALAEQRPVRVDGPAVRR